MNFSESLDNSTVTVNTSNTSCSGSFQMSKDNFTSCVRMKSSPSFSNSNKTFTVSPNDNLSYSTVYKIRITTAIKDILGNTTKICELHLYFTDGDGGVGLFDEDTVAPFDYNLFV